MVILSVDCRLLSCYRKCLRYVNPSLLMDIWLFEYAIILPALGDDRLRREKLVPECEPRGAELVNSAQKIKCQSHFLHCYAPRCISDQHNSPPPMMRARPPAPFSTR